MKIAITSCADPINQPEQDVWARIAKAQPDHLILLGDQIYMDYAPWPFSFFMGNPANGAPARFTDVQFATHMYERYRAQWRGMQASGLLRQGQLTVHGIWDDHDFAWNNSFGAGPRRSAKIAQNAQPVPAAKQQIARSLFRQFFSSLRLSEYPKNNLLAQQDIDALHEDLSQPVFHTDTPGPNAAAGLIPLAPQVNLLLTDGRTFRTTQDDGPAIATLFGRKQMDWILDNIVPGAITLIASGCTLGTAKEQWKHYREYAELLNHLAGRKNARVLVLSGDIHHTEVNDHYAAQLIEVVASGAARPFGNWLPWRPSRGNHVLCDISATQIGLQLCEGKPGSWNARQRSATIDCSNWRLKR